MTYYYYFFIDFARDFVSEEFMLIHSSFFCFFFGCKMPYLLMGWPFNYDICKISLQSA